jgi:hypothetical protein
MSFIESGETPLSVSRAPVAADDCGFTRDRPRAGVCAAFSADVRPSPFSPYRLHASSTSCMYLA